MTEACLQVRLGGIRMRWRRWRQDLRLWLRRRSLALSRLGGEVLSRRWVQQSLAAAAVLAVLAGVHRGQGAPVLGAMDRWLAQSITKPYDFRAASERFQSSALWRAARVPELVERLRQALAVPTLAQQGGSESGEGGETGLGAALQPPVPGTVLRGFGHGTVGSGSNTLFQGLELAAEAGTPVRAAASGVVVSVEADPIYGQRVTLDHGSGLRTCYAFSGQVQVKSQDRAPQGGILGTAAAKTPAAEARVYFEVQVDGRAVDPAPFLQEGPGSV